MEHPRELDKELTRMPVEPLLPIEKKLIAWSLGLGVGSLAVLVIVTRLFFSAT